MHRFQATCVHCGAVRLVAKPELDRARQPHCLKCGGPLELSQAAKEKLKEVQTAQRGDPVPTGKRKKKPTEAPPPRILPRHEAKRYQFWEHPDLYSWMLKDQARSGRDFSGINPQQFYTDKAFAGQMMEKTPADERYASGLVYASEASLYAAGRPYYKVWPAIATALCDTQMRIPGEHFRMPFPALEIRLPTVDNPLAPLCAAVVCRVEAATLGHDDGRDWSLVVMYFDNVPEFQRDDSGLYHIADIPIRPKELLEDSLAQTRLMQDCAQPDLTRRLVRVAVGTCFFGVDNHEAILPDLPRAVIDRYQREGRVPSATAAKKHLKEAKKAGLFGWKVGSEIDLPRPVIQHHPASEQGEHRELTSGHMRRGHMRMQPCGEKHQQRRLVFIPPTLVRPDLPLGSTHGYRVRVPKVSGALESLQPHED